MASFDRFDICEAYYIFEVNWNRGGWLQARPSNRRRMEATHIQLDRMQFKISPCHRGYESLTDNGKEIYQDLLTRYNLKEDLNENH